MIGLSDLPWKSFAPESPVSKDERLIDAFSTHWIKYVVPGVIYVFVACFLFLSDFFFLHNLLQIILRSSLF